MAELGMLIVYASAAAFWLRVLARAARFVRDDYDCGWSDPPIALQLSGVEDGFEVYTRADREAGHG